MRCSETLALEIGSRVAQTFTRTHTRIRTKEGTVGHLGETHFTVLWDDGQWSCWSYSVPILLARLDVVRSASKGWAP